MEISLFWAIIGTAAIVAAFVWGQILSKLKCGWGAATTITVVAIGAALPLLWSGRTAAYISAALLGGSFLAVVTGVPSFSVSRPVQSLLVAIQEHKSQDPIRSADAGPD